MEAFNPLSPNTAAFLDSIAASGDFEPKTVNPTSFPPSVFFGLPGTETPEDSSPSSAGDAKQLGQQRSFSISDDSDNDMPATAPNHKRKASENDVAVKEEEDDDDDSLSENGHEDKRQHPNEPKRNGPRRSTDGKKGAEKPGKDNLTKAQRRKEQNRAAQKAFRERREAKVRDLEQKVAELEAKSFGASVENENLRGILRRLQEENMALKSSGFTFSMPKSGAAAGHQSQPMLPQTQPQVQQLSGQQTPTQNQNGGIDWSTFANFKVQPQVAKPPSPPQSVSNDSLRSIHEPSPGLTHRASTGSNTGNSPESLVSLGPSPSSASDPASMPSLFSNNVNSPFQVLNRSNSSGSPADAISTASSLGGTNKDDVDALFRSLYPNGIDAVLAYAANASSVASVPPIALPAMHQPQYTFIGTQPGLTSYADSTSNNLAKLFGDATSYRDPSAAALPTNDSQSLFGNMSGNPSAAAHSTAHVSTATTTTTTNTAADMGSLSNQTAWSGLTENSVNEFLASLTGADDSALIGADPEESFSRQIEALIAQSGGGVSPSAAFNVPSNNLAFSPTNYLNMSPSPLQSIGSSQTPRSTPSSNVTSPQTTSDSVTGEVCGASNVIHVLGENGRVMRPSEVWTRMGMHSSSDPGDFLIDDLCDQMKVKATCKDGRRYMSFDDVEEMVRSREEKHTVPDHWNAPLPARPAQATSETCANKGAHDPAKCQARLNEAYLEANGAGM